MIILDKDYKLNSTRFVGIATEMNLLDCVQKSKNIIIKPNFAAGSYVKSDSHVVSSLELISDVVKAILDIDKDKTIYIAESDSTGYGYAFLKFENFGLPDSLQLGAEYQGRVKLLDLSRDRLKRVENEKFRYFTSIDRQLWLSETLMDSDLIISLSNLKSHSVTGYTGACKNLFGMLPDSQKWIYHTHINDVIHDLVVALNPAINIIDGFYAMEFNGPVSGKPINLGFRIWSGNALEADIAACFSVGIKPDQIKHLRMIKKTISCIQVIHDGELPAKMAHLHPPVMLLRIFNKVGLFIQRVGENLQELGHRIHNCSNLVEFIVALIRPFLLKVIGRERLKKMKNIILGEK